VNLPSAPEQPFPRTLFVLDNLYISGAEKIAVNLLRHAQARGLPADGIVFMDDHLGADNCGARLCTFEGPTGGSFFSRFLRGVSRVPALARAAADFDIIVPVTPPAIPWAVAAAKASNARVVPWVHYDLDGFKLAPYGDGRGVRDFLMNALFTRVAPAFDHLIFASYGAMDSFAKVRGGIRPGWAWAPNVYDRQALTDAPSVSAAALDACRAKGRAALLFAGRIDRHKRWEEAVKVAELLFARGFAFELHFAGDGPEMGQLRDAVERSPARERIFLHGFDYNVTAALSKADALLLTSLTEAWPTVVLESFDVGLPVLSYDCPSGPAEMLGRNLERGVLCVDAEELADRVVWLLDPRQAELRSAMTERAKLFLEDYRAERALVRWGEVLRNMME
jgi:glycosyltransferase involved in cell wall biosynthesis